MDEKTQTEKSQSPPRVFTVGSPTRMPAFDERGDKEVEEITPRRDELEHVEADETPPSLCDPSVVAPVPRRARTVKEARIAEEKYRASAAASVKRHAEKPQKSSSYSSLPSASSSASSSSALSSSGTTVPSDRATAAAASRKKTVAVFEGSFCPPTIAHMEAVSKLLEVFDRVVVLPAGQERQHREHRISSELVPPLHRAAMIDLDYHDFPGVTVDFSDLDTSDSQPSVPLMEHIVRLESAEEEVWLAVGASAVEYLRQEWAVGWSRLRLAVFERPRVCPAIADSEMLPPTCKVFEGLDNDLDGKDVRELIFFSQDYGAFVSERIAHYVYSHMLFRGLPPPPTMSFCINTLRAMLVWDTRNPLACDVALKLKFLEDTRDPNVLIVIGGDGTMLRAIREHWRKRLPFFGVNCGHLGFLLNDLPASLGRLLDPNFSFCGEVLLHHLPLLKVEITDNMGHPLPDQVCFNDAWVERASGQSAWIGVMVNGETKISRLVADGMLVCTAAGSTAYAQSMGCCPVPVGSSLMCVVGNNVSMPLSWRPVYLPLDCTVECTNLDTDKRPLKAFVDGVEIGSNVSSMRIRASNVADCRLVFLKKDTMIRKLSKLQFPSVSVAPVTTLPDMPFVPLAVTPPPRR